MILRRNVLIFHLAALGDFVLTWPLALGLGRLFPQSRILYVTHQQKGLLARRVLGVEYADVEQGWHRLFADDGELPPHAARLIGGAHSIFTFLPGQRFASVAPAAQVHQLQAATEGVFDGHASQFLLQQLAAVPAMEAATQQMIHSINDRGLARATERRREIVLHPGSGSPSKCWPVERYAELAGRFAREGWPVRILLGEVELDRWPAAAIKLLEGSGVVHRPASYVDLYESLAAASLVIANDSGPGHLAGVSGVPTLSLFGPTDPERWKPLGPRVRTLRREPLNDLSVDEIHVAALPLLQAPMPPPAAAVSE